MKFKILGLILSAGLALAACDADNSNDKATSPDDNAKSDVNSSGTNKSDDVKKDEDSNAAKGTDANDNDDSSDADEDDQSSHSSDDSTADDDSIALNAISSTPDDIIKILHTDNHTGKLTGISFEKENNEWVYKVAQNENDKNVEYTYSMEDRKLLNTEEDAVDKEDQTFDYDEVKKFETAIKKARDKAGNKAKIKEWSLDTDDGNLVYNVELMDGTTEKSFNVDPFEGLVTEDK